jgi:CBS-domain-containing membrane protein
METHLSTTTADEPLADAGRRMLEGKIGCLPVVGQDGRLIGILTESDFVRWTTTLPTEMAAPRGTRSPVAATVH